MAALDLSNEDLAILRGTALEASIRHLSTKGCGCDYLPDLATDVFRFLLGTYVPFDERVPDVTGETGREGNVVFVDFGNKGDTETE